MSEIEFHRKTCHDCKRTSQRLHPEDRIWPLPPASSGILHIGRRFALYTNGLTKWPVMSAAFRTEISLVFVGRSGRAFPDGSKLCARRGAEAP